LFFSLKKPYPAEQEEEEQMICKRKTKIPAEKPFYLQYAKNYTSQNGEDGVLEAIFNSIYSRNNNSLTKDHFCIDVGAWDGKHWSNTYHLVHDLGWGGILIEADQEKFALLSQLYENRKDVSCVKCIADCSGENNLLNILWKAKCPKDPSFLCIDIDGADYHLWESLGNQIQPDVVCIEFNPTIPNDIFYIQPPDIRIQKGSSLLALTELGQKLGYSLVACTTWNAIFVKNKFVTLLPFVPVQHPRIDLDLIHIPTMVTELFQTYDGELCYVGTKKLLWHDLALNPQKLQILSKKNQKFPFSPYEIEILHELDKCYENILSWRQNIQQTNSSSQTNTPGSPKSSNHVISRNFQHFIKLLSIPTFQGLTEKKMNRLLWELVNPTARNSLPNSSSNSPDKYIIGHTSRNELIWNDTDRTSCNQLTEGILLLCDQLISFALNFITTDVNQGLYYLNKIFSFLELFSLQNKSILLETNNYNFILSKFLELSIHFLRCYRLIEDQLLWKFWENKFHSFSLLLMEKQMYMTANDIQIFKALKVVMERDTKKFYFTMCNTTTAVASFSGSLEETPTKDGCLIPEDEDPESNPLDNIIKYPTGMISTTNRSNVESNDSSSAYSSTMFTAICVLNTVIVGFWVYSGLKRKL
jgi:hypothetical protein